MGDNHFIYYHPRLSPEPPSRPPPTLSTATAGTNFYHHQSHHITSNFYHCRSHHSHLQLLPPPKSPPHRQHLPLQKPSQPALTFTIVKAITANSNFSYRQSHHSHLQLLPPSKLEHHLQLKPPSKSSHHVSHHPSLSPPKSPPTFTTSMWCGGFSGDKSWRWFGRLWRWKELKMVWWL